MKSPYDGHDVKEWADITDEIVKKYPVSEKDIIESVQEA